VSKVLEDAVLVTSQEGFEGRVFKREVVFDPSINLADVIFEGSEVDVIVKSVDLKKGQANLSLLKSEADPINKYHSGQIVEGRVVRLLENGALIEIEPGVMGFAHISELAWARVDKIEGVVQNGQVVLCRILNITIEDRRLRLTLFGIFEEIIWVPPSHIFLIVGRKGANIQNIAKETQTHIDLDEDGVCRIVGQTKKNIDVAHQRIIQFASLRIITFKLSERQVRHLIGREGQTIKGIQNDSGSQINIDPNGEVTVIAESEADIQKSIDMIRDVVSFYKAVVRVPTANIGRVVGTAGRTIIAIQTETTTEIDIIKDQPGLITIEGKSQQSVERALQRIENLASQMEILSQLFEKLPKYQEVRTTQPSVIQTFIIRSTKPPQETSLPDSSLFQIRSITPSEVMPSPEETVFRILSTSTPESMPSESRMPVFRIRTLLRPSGSSIGQKSRGESFLGSRKIVLSMSTEESSNTNPLMNRWAFYEKSIQLPLSYLPLLFRREGSSFQTIFSDNRTVLDKIQEETNTEVRVNLTTGDMVIRGNQSETVTEALYRVRAALR
jgi:polyribonucleotide nucleotidyltransferase